ncbi:MAG: Uma2 family endonuclease [Anaerolineae bacterium]|jgi:Uma2 family endonuclease|nr:Uma2 family endonuclease [Anaerolineae bacterium]
MLDTTKMTTIDEYLVFASLPENDGKYFELNNGEIIEMTPPTSRHVRVAGYIFAYLLGYIESNDLGIVFADNCGYLLSKRRLVIPDASFVSKGRIEEPTPNIIPLAPDLAVEVVSPSNTHLEMTNKIEDYLNYGTKMVWIVYPEEKVVDVIRKLEDGGKYIKRYTINDTILGEDVIPDLIFPVVRMFPKS